MKGTKVKKVKIKFSGYTLEGEVISAYNYGTDDNQDWYIEFTDSQYGYVYWKQRYDGGRLIWLKDETLEATR